MKYGEIYSITFEELDKFDNLSNIIECLGPDIPPDIPKYNYFKHDRVIIDKKGKLKRNSKYSLGWTISESIYGYGYY